MPTLVTAQKMFPSQQVFNTFTNAITGKSFQVKTSKKYITLFYFNVLRQVLAKGHIRHLQQVT